MRFMIRQNFLNAAERKELLSLARDGSAEHRIARRANAILLLDDGFSCERAAKVLYLDDDTVRSWRKLYDDCGIAALEQFDAGGSSSRLSAEQEEALKAYVARTLPRSTRQIGAFIEREFGVVYESRAGLIAFLHRLGLEYHKPDVIGRKLDTEKQQAFIESYEKLSNTLGPDEAVLFLDAVHPTHAARPVGCWAPKEENLAIEQTSGRQRINIHKRTFIVSAKRSLARSEFRDRRNPHDRGRNHRRRLDDQAFGSAAKIRIWSLMSIAAPTCPPGLRRSTSLTTKPDLIYLF